MSARESTTDRAETRVELANRLFREYYSVCFWHYRPDLNITEEQVSLVIRGLRAHGGRKGFLAAEKLVSTGEPTGECR